MKSDRLIILDPKDRRLYTEIMLKLRRIDNELCRLHKDLHTKHKMHADSVLQFAFLDLQITEARARYIQDKELRLDIRSELLKRKDYYYQTYDVLNDTGFHSEET